MINFIDMCSMTNISVLMLLENRYGYYIHGRSPHEMADIDMRQMLMQFQQESKQMIGKRGLETGSDDQSFIIKVSRPFRSAYDNLLFNYQVSMKTSFLNENFIWFSLFEESRWKSSIEEGRRSWIWNSLGFLSKSKRFSLFISQPAFTNAQLCRSTSISPGKDFEYRIPKNTNRW